jgi:CDGSH-type Zn-finger protein
VASSFKKTNNPLVHFELFTRQIEIENLDQLVLCRCWKSKKFPLCDGSHGDHNSSCGDNVGPIIIKNDKKAPAAKKE